jgi:hypothetical protein
MKTTIEISDALLGAAKTLAKQNRTSLRAVVEEGLRRILSDRQVRDTPTFKLRDLSVRGGEILVNHPGQWQRMESDHVAARNANP